MRNPIRVAYFIRIPNVGDLVNPSVVTTVSGREVVFARRRDVPHLLAVGSVMAGANEHAHVWGTGVMHPDLGIGSAKPENVHAVRGRMSWEALRRGGLALADVPLGDPAFLAPKFLGVQRARAPRYRLGIVAHYVDRGNTLLRRIMQEDGVSDLNVHETPERFLRRMADCEAVMSTSLHGLIFAEALGIPNLWVKASDEIAGGTFKFEDWFSTTSRPQASAHVLGWKDRAASLAARAELHECQIDTQALEDAFPREHLEELEEPVGPSFVPVSACRERPIPVFLISYNRGRMLRRAIEAIRGQWRPTEIVIHDNGSTDEETIEILRALEAEGIKVYWRGRIQSADDLNRVNESVTEFFRDWAEPARYVVSDCDVDLSVAEPVALDVYDELLNQFRRSECVGPMLRIRDIPRDYPLYNRVMNRHIEQFWRHLPRIKETPFGVVAVLGAPIDTTFALHRAGEDFRRLKQGLRVYEPFEALHLDWYKVEMSGVYTETSSPEVSHWDNKKELAAHKDVACEYEEFYVVRKAEGGALEIERVRLEDLGSESRAPGT